MRVLVCGGRDFDDWELLYRTLDKLPANEITIIEGGAIGADFLSRVWAKHRRQSYVEFPADWKTHGRAAGPIRNKQMLIEGEPDLVVAFPGGRGTANMVQQARSAGVPVSVVMPLPEPPEGGDG